MNSWTQIVGWTLIHFAWQGAIVGLLTAGVLRLYRHRSANARYVIACVALMIMLASALVTARVLAGPDLSLGLAVIEPDAVTLPGALSTASSNGTHDEMTLGSGALNRIDEALPGIVLIWLAGVAVLLLRMAAGLLKVRQLQVTALANEASRWQSTAEQIARRLGIRTFVRVVETTEVDSPTALGWLRPVILLPIAALANLTPVQVEAILTHELIHIRRHDYVINVLQTIAETVLFYHPAVWWTSRQIRIEREHYCDDVAVQVCGDPVEYAAALTELEEWRSREVSLALAATGGSLRDRVRRLLKAPVDHDARSLNWIVPVGLTLALAAGVYVLSAAPSQAEGTLADNGVQSASASDAGQAIEPMASPVSFGWQVLRTDHFDIHYYPALGSALQPAADSAELAYRRISTELRHDLPFRVPLILFKTRSDFQQQTIVPQAAEAIARGQVAAFTEPRRGRVVMLVDENPSVLHQRITHELTHAFAFEIIPRSEAQASGRVPIWVDEGLAEYMSGVWDPVNLSRIRELVSAGNVPSMTALTGGETDQTRGAVANLGHAAFEFIEAEYGKAAVWQFLNEIRRNVVDGAGEVYPTAFNRTPEEFDSAFAQYLRRRFNL
ncbi:MAG: M56 family metallopeptidase [Acidobacteria bacterium]|nr:M56 family metallopeptidase [Acidobacteriota bacterium]